MSIIRLLHLSDLHLAGKYRAFYEKLEKLNIPLSVHHPDVLSAVSEIIYNWRDEFDGVLITGDISTTGFKDDLQIAIDWLNEKTNLTLTPDGFAKPIILVPGNHDRYANLAGFPGTKFDQYFSSYWSAGFGGIQTFFVPDRVSPLLSIVSADFSLKHIYDSSCPFGHYGQGKVYRDRLLSLVNETKGITKYYPNCGIVWMIHFAPEFEKHHQLDRKMLLLKSDDLIEAAKNIGIRYIFCGHTHQSSDYLTLSNRGVTIHCAGTSTCLGDDHNTTIHIRLIELDGPRIIHVMSRSFLYDPMWQTFN